MFKNFAVFLDRDGTINVDVDFLSSPSQLELIPGSGEAIRTLNMLEIPVFVVTNQSGIARGLFSEEDLFLVHQALDEQLKMYQAHVDGYFFCPHHPTDGIGKYRIDCPCRKPKTGMAVQAQKKIPVDLTRSFVVGDKAIDMQFGRAIRSTTIQVATGYGTKEKELAAPYRDYYTSNIASAVDLITNKLGIEQTSLL